MADTLASILSGPSLIRERWLPPEMAVREVVNFERRFGPKHLWLACHAALPLIVTPELINLIQLNFLDKEKVPWLAQTDFLLSSLCRPIDEGLYEVEPGVREVLLVELETRFGWQRPLELAHFLQTYLAEKPDRYQRPDISRTHHWLALAYLDPDRVIEEMNEFLEESLAQGSKMKTNLPGQIQLATILEIAAEPLERANLWMEHQHLVNNSRMLTQLLYRPDTTTLEKIDQPSQKQTVGRIGNFISPRVLELWRRNQYGFTPPTEPIPDPAPLPDGSRIIFARNSLFIRNEDNLRRLADHLLQQSDNASSVPIMCITGMGGLGKTQLASEFVHRYGQYFDGGVFWLNFADPAAIPAEIAACGGQGYLDLVPNFNSLDLENQVKLVLTAWNEPATRLLIFDQCEDEDLLTRWCPKLGGCRVLVTSRRGIWDPALQVETLRLGVLSRAESVALLRGYRPDLAEDDARLYDIAAELGDLPLALHLAGSFLARYQDSITPQEYLKQLQDQDLLEHPSMSGRKDKEFPTDYEVHVGRTFALSFDRLDAGDEVDALALKILARAACFAPGEPIPRTLLVSTLSLPKEKVNITSTVESALVRSVELGLLDEEPDEALMLHRLVAVFVVRASPDLEARAAVEDMFLGESNRLKEAGYSGSLLVWQSHLRYVTSRAIFREDERGANLGQIFGNHLHQIGDYAGARPYFEQALIIYANLLGTEHPSTADSLNNLGSLTQAMGNYEEARPYFERALSIYEKALGPEHPDTASSLNNIGAVLYAMGNYEEARPYFERVLAIYEKVLGPEHPNTASSLNNLGSLTQAMGNYEEAQPYFERALSIYEKALGPEHPDTALSLNNIGAVLYAMGNYEKARPYFERALSIYEKVLGPEHPNTASSLNNLGALLQTKGNYEGAQPYFERALSVYEKALGPEHPDTLSSANNLKALFKAMGDYRKPKYTIFGQAGQSVIGDQYNASGDFHVNIINIKSTLTSVHEEIVSIIQVNEDTKQKLIELIKELNTSLEQFPSDRVGDAEVITKLVQNLIDLITDEKPNRGVVQITGESLKKAAENVQDIAPITQILVTEIVRTIFTLPSLRS